MSAARLKVARRLRPKEARARSIALFGGTFDPIHAGHLVVAQAAVRRFHLDAIYFIPSGRPPHKPDADLTPFPHRYAMVTLGCVGSAKFLPSLAEAQVDGSKRVFYSIDTVRKFRSEVLGKRDRLYFLIGADAFLEIRTWKGYEELLRSCDFIVASRPGFQLDALRRVIPPALLKHSRVAKDSSISLGRTVVYLLPTVRSHVSATEVRERAARGQSLRGLVPAPVEEYIFKQALYR